MEGHVCKKGHPLKWTPLCIRFRCDVCKRTDENPCWGCEQDDFYICTRCSPAPADYISFGKCLDTRPKPHHISTGFLPSYLCIECRGACYCAAHWLSAVDKDQKDIEISKVWHYPTEKDHNRRHLWLVRTELSQATESVDDMLKTINVDDYDPALRLFYAYSCSLCTKDKITGPLYFSSKNPAVHVCLDCFDKLAFTQLMKQHTPWLCTLSLMTKVTLPTIGIAPTEQQQQQQPQQYQQPSYAEPQTPGSIASPLQKAAPPAGGYADAVDPAVATVDVRPQNQPANVAGYADAGIISNNYAAQDSFKSSPLTNTTYASADVAPPSSTPYAAADTLTITSATPIRESYSAADTAQSPVAKPPVPSPALAAAPAAAAPAHSCPKDHPCTWLTRQYVCDKCRKGYRGFHWCCPGCDYDACNNCAAPPADAAASAVVAQSSNYAAAESIKQAKVRKDTYSAVDAAATAYAAAESLKMGVSKESYATLEGALSRPSQEARASVASNYDVVDSDDTASQPPASAINLAAVKPSSVVQSIAAAPAPPPVISPHTTTPRPWNEQFQSIMALPSSTPQEKVEKALALKNLHDAFVAEATRLARIIVNEMHLPAQERTIKPKDFGGVAGGSKFAENGIFIKFATDIHGIYGGDTFAMKSASLELLGLKWFFRLNLPGLHVPLMALVNFRGWRLVCTSALPLGKDTLRYGSDDGGVTVKGGTIDRAEAPDLQGKEEFLNGRPVVHQGDPVLNDLMRQAGELLQLKAHKVGRTPIKPSIYGPTDIEGHLGKDGRYYVVDTARVFPPEPLWKSQVALYFNNKPMQLKQERRGYNNADGSEQSFDRLLNISWEIIELTVTREKWKDEIARHLETPFDSLQRLQVTDAIVLVTGRGLVNIPLSLYVGVVLRGPGLLLPAFGSKAKSLYCLMRPEFMLNREYISPKRAPSKPFNSDAFTAFGMVDPNIKEDNEDIRKEVQVNLPIQVQHFHDYFANGNERLETLNEFSDRLHDFGINVRYTGWLCSILGSEPSPMERCFRSTLRTVALMSLWMRTWKVYVFEILRRTQSERAYKETLVRYLNLLFGSSRRADLFRQVHMKIALTSKFGKFPQFPSWILHSVATLKFKRSAVFMLLRNKLGVKFAPRVDVMLDETAFHTGEPFSINDVLSVEPIATSVLDEYLEYSFAAAMYDISGNTPIERTLALHNQLQEFYPENSPEYAQSLLQVAECYAYHDLESAEGYAVLARAAFEALTVRSASVAISYFYVMSLIESQRQHRTNSVRYALAALLVLSYLYPSARYWDTSIGVGSTGDRPIEHAPYRIGSAHPLALVILAKLGNLFRSEACSPFMSILCVETFDAILHIGFPGDIEAAMAIFGAPFPVGIAFLRSSHAINLNGQSSHRFVDHFRHARPDRVSFADPRTCLAINVGRSYWAVTDITGWSHDTMKPTDVWPFGNASLNDVAMRKWLDRARMRIPCSPLELRSLTLDQLLERQFTPISRSDMLRTTTARFICPSYIDAGEELTVQIEFRALDDYKSQGYIYLHKLMPTIDSRYRPRLITKVNTPRVQADADGCYRVSVVFPTEDLSDGTYAVNFNHTDFNLTAYNYEMVHVGSKTKRELARQVMYYPCLGQRPEIAIPMLDLAGKTLKKMYFAHGSAFALTTDGFLFATGSGDKGQLGQGNKEHSPHAWLKVPITSVLVDFAATPSFPSRGTPMICVACDENGSVFLWGQCEKFMSIDTRHSSSEINTLIPSPRIIDAFVGLRIVKVGMAESHIAALSQDGKLYFYGAGCPPFVQAGKFVPIPCGTPTEAPMLRSRPVRDIHVYSTYGTIILESGEVLTYHEASTELHPVRLDPKQKAEVPGGVRFVMAGKAHDDVLLDDIGQVWIYGSTVWLGEWGRPSSGKRKLTCVSNLRDARFVSIQTSGNRIYAFTQEGELWAMHNDGWGCFERVDVSPLRVSCAAYCEGVGLFISYDGMPRDLLPTPPPLPTLQYLLAAPFEPPARPQLSTPVEAAPLAPPDLKAAVKKAAAAGVAAKAAAKPAPPAVEDLIEYVPPMPSAPVVVSLRKNKATTAAPPAKEASQEKPASPTIAPTAQMAAAATRAPTGGVFVSPNVIIGPNVVIGPGVIINNKPAAAQAAAPLPPTKPIATPEFDDAVQAPQAAVRREDLLAQVRATLTSPPYKPLIALLEAQDREIAELREMVEKQAEVIKRLAK